MLNSLTKTILVTAGGTIVKIDDVRHISNFSSGQFASRIAEEALKKGYIVFYLHAKKAKKPFDLDLVFNPNIPAKPQFNKIANVAKTYSKLKKNLRLYNFETVDDYSSSLKKILENNDIDIAFLMAAVSDYGLIKKGGKISSSADTFNLKLFKYPKIIKSVKSWSRKQLFQVGFKLLSGVNENKLTETAYKSGLDNQSNLTVANDLKHLKDGKRNVVIITPEKGRISLCEPDLAKKVLEFVLKRAKATYFRTLMSRDKSFVTKYGSYLKPFKSVCGQLYKDKLMPPFYSRSKSSHGSLAVRVSGNSFLITARGSNKKDLGIRDMVLVKKVDWENKRIHTSSLGGYKPSLNAILCSNIFSKFPKVNVILHTHTFDKNAPTTKFEDTPGTLEYAEEAVKLLKTNLIVNLKNHGLIAVGENIKIATNYVYEK